MLVVLQATAAAFVRLLRRCIQLDIRKMGLKATRRVKARKLLALCRRQRRAYTRMAARTKCKYASRRKRSAPAEANTSENSD